MNVLPFVKYSKYYLQTYIYSINYIVIEINYITEM